MPMEETSERTSLNRARRIPYGLGIVLCVLWPLFLELMLTRLPQGEPSSPPAVESIGHTFTGLIILAAVFVFWRRNRAKSTLADQGLPARCASIRRETLVAAVVFGACSLLGPLYFGAAGARGERHARSFIATSPIMFFVFAPRARSWASRPAEPREGHG